MTLALLSGVNVPSAGKPQVQRGFHKLQCAQRAALQKTKTRCGAIVNRLLGSEHSGAVVVFGVKGP